MQFTFELYKTIVSSEEGNVLISPLSVTVALSMTLMGGRSNTAEQMKKVLIMENNEETFSKYSEIISHFCENSDTVKIANRMYLQKDYSIESDFTSSLKKIFRSDCGIVDFINDSINAKNSINSWVSSVTENKINDLLGDVEPSTRLILISAIYFKGFWAKKFSTSLTEKHPFYVTKDKTVNTDMMYQKGKFGYLEDEELQAQVLQLPYEKDALSMIIILPSEIDGLKEIENKLSSNKFNSLCNEVKSDVRKLHVLLPKFKLESAINLKAVLSKMGITDLFDPTKADLSGINNNRDLYVDEVIHKAFIDVNEEGTEAAAATAVLVQNCCLEIIPEFKADHPFLYFVVDHRYNNILFIGSLKLPQSAK
ncbi:leukocyte elastase inhibitor A-like [Centruroides sculpturatus]|uniref:leukocyte elastase inhibitor A-like n=1 Tax=Centruroides sculpturatus TaxID=218467 RepID=UPI000C6E98FE|nr:leukocyte elastase inhibitor A-like [Centruroides sculpturatus]XP_023217366.1 leukocyte elastase inhibitor A-like [Centruroides sculpturatus]